MNTEHENSEYAAQEPAAPLTPPDAALPQDGAEERETPASPSKPEEKSDLASDLFYWAQSLTVALLILVIINTWFVRLSGVHGSSMEPTFSSGQQVLMQIMGYEQPQRGEVVVVTADAFPGEPLIKRVIGLEGDVIDFDTAKGVLILNGEVQYEPYILEQMAYFGTQEYPYTVPEGCVFVMGDNRNGSSDSRLAIVGALPTEDVIGRVFFRIWPFGRFGVIR